MNKGLRIVLGILGAIAFVVMAWLVYRHTSGASVAGADLPAMPSLEEPTFEGEELEGDLEGQTAVKLQAVSVQLPQNLVVTGNIDLRCQGIPVEGAEIPPAIVIKEAREVSKCRKPHYSLVDTSTPMAAIQSYKKIVDEDDRAAQEGDSHDYEYWDLISTYAFLASPEELKELEKLATRKDDVGSIANDTLHAREIGSQQK